MKRKTIREFVVEHGTLEPRNPPPRAGPGMIMANRPDKPATTRPLAAEIAALLRQSNGRFPRELMTVH